MTLELIVTDGGDNPDNDHADWGKSIPRSPCPITCDARGGDDTSTKQAQSAHSSRQRAARGNLDRMERIGIPPRLPNHSLLISVSPSSRRESSRWRSLSAYNSLDADVYGAAQSRNQFAEWTWRDVRE
jgi:hypothetical protein